MTDVDVEQIEAYEAWCRTQKGEFDMPHISEAFAAGYSAASHRLTALSSASDNVMLREVIADLLDLRECMLFGRAPAIPEIETVTKARAVLAALSSAPVVETSGFAAGIEAAAKVAENILGEDSAFHQYANKTVVSSWITSKIATAIRALKPVEAAPSGDSHPKEQELSFIDMARKADVCPCCGDNKGEWLYDRCPRCDPESMDEPTSPSVTVPASEIASHPRHTTPVVSHETGSGDIQAPAALEKAKLRARKAITDRYYLGGNVRQMTSVKPAELVDIVADAILSTIATPADLRGAARNAVERLANVPMNISLEEWGELSRAILAALGDDHG